MSGTLCRSVVVSVLILLADTHSMRAADPWPMQGHDPARTSRTTAPGPQVLALKWTYDFARDRLQDNACPIVGADGTIYVPTEHDFYAVRPDGTLKWRTFGKAAHARRAPALSPDGSLVLVASAGSTGQLHALAASSGWLRWQLTVGDGSYSSIAVDADGAAYLGETSLPNSHEALPVLAAFNADGTLRWRQQWAFPGWGIEAPPAVDALGNVSVISNAPGLVSVDSKGQPRWEKDVENYYGWGTPLIGPDGAVYVTGEASVYSTKVFALNRDGTSKWLRTDIAAPGYFHGMAISTDGTTVFTPGGGGIIHALKAANGETLWSRPIAAANETFGASPALAANGVLVVMGDGGQVYAVSTTDGSPLWQYTLNSTPLYWGPQSPAIGPDGTLYVVASGDYGYMGGTTSARLYAFGTLVAGPPVATTWNGDGVVDRGDCATLSIPLQNVGLTSVGGIVASLAARTPGVTVSQASSSYADLALHQTGNNATPFDIVTAPDFVCGTPIELTLDLITDQGRLAIPLALPTFSRTATTSASGPVTADAANPTVELPVAVADITGTIAKVTAALFVTHQAAASLDVSLIGPDGTTVVLRSSWDSSFEADHGTDCPADGNDCVFDDAAPIAVADAGGFFGFVGTFRPRQPLAAFAGKSGAAANGTWKLRVTNRSSRFPATLQCWSLTVSELPALPCRSGGCQAPFLAVQGMAVDDTVGNGNGGVDANECVKLVVTLRNTGPTPSTGLTAKLASATPGVSVTQGSSAYPDIPASASAANAVPFELGTAAGFACGKTIDLTLDVATTRGTFAFPLRVATGGPPQTVSVAAADIPKVIPPESAEPGLCESSVTLSSAGGAIASVKVALHVHHVAPELLSLALIGPDGTEVGLSSGSESHGLPDMGANCLAGGGATTFDDEAATWVTEGKAPFVGSFHPEHPLAALGERAGRRWTVCGRCALCTTATPPAVPSSAGPSSSRPCRARREALAASPRARSAGS